MGVLESWSWIGPVFHYGLPRPYTGTDESFCWSPARPQPTRLLGSRKRAPLTVLTRGGKPPVTKKREFAQKKNQKEREDEKKEFERPGIYATAVRWQVHQTAVEVWTQDVDQVTGLQSSDRERTIFHRKSVIRFTPTATECPVSRSVNFSLRPTFNSSISAV